MIKYKAECWMGPKITKVEVERTTKSSVFIDGRMERKKTDDKVYFDTFSEAKEWLVMVYDRKAQVARRNLELANARLGNAKGLKEV